MKNLSIGTTIAWQIAAMEAGAARFQFIEAEHIIYRYLQSGEGA